MDNLVTIAIASYNNAPYIERCVNSVINQSYPNLEILIVDDGSIDNTLECVEKYRYDSRVKIVCKENGGLSSVRQVALDMATGDYISFIDADDYLMPEYIEEMLIKMQADKSDVCVCGTRVEDENGEVDLSVTKAMSCFDSQEPLRTYQYEVKNGEREPRVFLSDSWNKLFRVSFLRKANVKFCMKKGLNGTDKLFNTVLALHSPFYSTISNTLYIHVIYGKSAVHRKKKDLFQTGRILTTYFIEEGKRIGVPREMLSKWSSQVYYRSLRRAYQNVFDEEGFWHFLFKDIHQLNHQHKLYINQHQEIKSSIKYASTHNEKISLFIIKYLRPILPVYFLVRSFMMSTK